MNRKTLTGLEKQSLCINSLLLYITQDCDSELQVDTAFLSNLKKLKRTIETKQQNMLQQTSILAFYH